MDLRCPGVGSRASATWYPPWRVRLCIGCRAGGYRCLVDSCALCGASPGASDWFCDVVGFTALGLEESGAAREG